MPMSGASRRGRAVLLGKPCDQGLLVGGQRLFGEQSHGNRIAADDVEANHEAVTECRLADRNPEASGRKERLNAKN